MASVAELLNSPSLKKQKFKVSNYRTQAYKEDRFHFLYLSSDSDRILLILNQKEFETHQTVLKEGSVLMVCRLAILDTIQDIPVFKLQPGKSVLKQSRMDIADCLGFENNLISEIQTKTGALLDQAIGMEIPLPEGPKINLLDFLNRRPETVESSQFVEVVVLDSYVKAVTEDKGVCKMFVSSKNNDAAESTIQSIQTWVESKDDLERLQNSSKIEKRTILHIKADKLRNKMCGPLSGPQRGKINSTVERDQGFAKQLIKFKYPNYVVDDEALRKSGNLELKRDFFFDDTLVFSKGKISYAELVDMLQARAKSEEQGLPRPGNACLYLYECNSVGKFNGESFGEVYIHPHLESTKKVAAKTWAMSGVMDNMNVTIEPSKAYLIMLCFLKDSVVKSAEDDQQFVMKIEFLIEVDEDFYEELLLRQAADSTNKRPLEEDQDTTGSKFLKK